VINDFDYFLFFAKFEAIINALSLTVEVGEIETRAFNSFVRMSPIFHVASYMLYLHKSLLSSPNRLHLNMAKLIAACYLLSRVFDYILADKDREIEGST
jgi:hypothetical protein